MTTEVKKATASQKREDSVREAGSMKTVYLCDPDKNTECRAHAASCAYNPETPLEQRFCFSTTDREYALTNSRGEAMIDPRYQTERKDKRAT